MGNFDFVRQTLPSVADDCARAESYLSSDPRSACFYSRRVVEELVGYLYEVLSLSIPYRDDLAAKIGNGVEQRPEERSKAVVPARGGQQRLNQEHVRIGDGEEVVDEAVAPTGPARREVLDEVRGGRHV